MDSSPIDVPAPSDNGPPAAEPRPTPAPGGAAGGDVAAPNEGPSDGPSEGSSSDGPDGGPESRDGGPSGEQKRKRRRRRKRGGGQGAPLVDGAVAPGEGAAPVGAEQSPSGPAAPRRDGPQQGRGERRRDRERGREGSRERGPGRDRDRDRPRDGRGNHEHSALFAVKALSQMAQSLLRVEGVDPFSVPRYVELNLRIPLDDRADARAAAAAAMEQILQRLREVREHERALQPGAVFCYFNDSAAVEHCRPAEARQVFEGYNSTGRPVWGDFVTMAIERKDPGIDLLLAGNDMVLTHVSMGRVLRTQQLAEFGGESAVYKILGQVDAGLFRVLGAEQKCAFSFQLLRGKTIEGKPRLRLHAVGKVDLMDLADPGVLNILSRFQRHLDSESLRLQGKEKNGEVDDEAFVLPLLQDLAQKLSGRARSTARRTQHAVVRSEEGQRPTPRAYPDAGEAHDDAILWDTEKATIVVAGPKGRVHVFTAQARHVTSVVMQGSAIDRRRQQGRWRQAEPEERGEFRVHLRQLIASGQDTPNADEPIQIEP